MNKNAVRTIAGLLLAMTIALLVADAFLPGAWRFASGVTAWMAGALLWRGVSAPARRQALALASLGTAGLVWGALHDVVPDWGRVAAANAPLIGMLAAVSFLRLVTRPPEADPSAAPGGRRAVLTTLLGVHLFGAVINMSTVFIVAERIKRGATLDAIQVRLLTRGFSAAAFWSPFFAAMAAALTFAPGARLEPLLVVGIPLAVLALALTYRELAAEAGASFQGYPVRFGSLWLPGLLAALVLLLHQWLPDVPILALISFLAPSLSLVVLLVRREQALAIVGRHFREGLPAMGSELALFLSAGVLAAGLGSVFATFGNWVPFAHFGGVEAGLTLLAMVMLAIVGVHPVVAVASVGILLQPLDPDPNLLAMTFLAAWAIGVAVSPLSGMNLAIQGVYAVPARLFLRANAAYAGKMLLAASLLLYLFAEYL